MSLDDARLRDRRSRSVAVAVAEEQEARYALAVRSVIWISLAILSWGVVGLAAHTVSRFF